MYMPGEKHSGWGQVMVYGRRDRNRKSGPSLAIHNAGDMDSISGGGTKIPHYFFGTTKKEKK